MGVSSVHTCFGVLYPIIIEPLYRIRILAINPVAVSGAVFVRLGHILLPEASNPECRMISQYLYSVTRLSSSVGRYVEGRGKANRQTGFSPCFQQATKSSTAETPIGRLCPTRALDRQIYKTDTARFKVIQRFLPTQLSE